MSTERRSYIQSTYGSAARYELVADAIDFPKDVKGKVILDIGSSASNAVKRLNKLGARAYGIDFQYAGLRNLVGSVEPSFTDPNRWNFPVARHIEPKLRGKEGELPKPEKNPVKRFLGWFGERLNDYGTWGPSANYLRRSEAVYREFLQDFNSVHKVGQYIAARSEFLPFQDSSVDLIYSVEALSTFVIRDKDAFIQSMREALRVTKSGGQIQLDPWYDQSNPFWSARELRNAQDLLRFLKNKDITYSVEKHTQQESGGRLRIVKP